MFYLEGNGLRFEQFSSEPFLCGWRCKLSAKNFLFATSYTSGARNLWEGVWRPLGHLHQQFHQGNKYFTVFLWVCILIFVLSLKEDNCKEGQMSLASFIFACVPYPFEDSLFMNFTLKLKRTVLRDRFRKCWVKLTDLGLDKGRGWFLNFSEAPLIFNRFKTSFFR